MAFEVPTAVERLLMADVAAEIARPFGDQSLPTAHRRGLPGGILACAAGFLAQVPGLAGTGSGAV